MRRSTRFFSRRSLASLSAVICLLLLSGPALAAQDLSRAIVKPAVASSGLSFVYIDLQDAGEIAARLAGSELFPFLASDPTMLSLVAEITDNFPAQELVLLAATADEREFEDSDSIQVAMRYGEELRPALARLAAGAAEEEDIASLLGFVDIALADLLPRDETGSKAPYMFAGIGDGVFISAHDDVLLISNNDKLINRSLASLRSLSDRYSFKNSNSTAGKSTARNRILWQATPLLTSEVLVDFYEFMFGISDMETLKQGHYVDAAINLRYKGFDLDMKSNVLPLMFSKLLKKSPAPKQFQPPQHGDGRLVIAAERANLFTSSPDRTIYDILAEILMESDDIEESGAVNKALTALFGDEEVLRLLFTGENDAGVVLTERPDSGELRGYIEFMTPNAKDILKALPAAASNNDPRSNWPYVYEQPIAEGELGGRSITAASDGDSCLIGLLPLTTLGVPPTTSDLFKTLVEQPLIGYSYFDTRALRRLLNARRDHFHSAGKMHRHLLNFITIATLDCHEVGSQMLSADHFVLHVRTGWLDFDGREFLKYLSEFYR